MVHGRGGSIGGRSPLKPTKVTLFTVILYNSENSILDIRPFCRRLFCHRSVVKNTSKTSLPNFTENAPPNLIG